METPVVPPEKRQLSNGKMRLVVGVPLAALVLLALFFAPWFLAGLLVLALLIALVELANLATGGKLPGWVPDSVVSFLKLPLEKLERVPLSLVVAQGLVLITGIACLITADFVSAAWAGILLLNIMATDACAYWVRTTTAQLYKWAQPDVPDELRKKPLQFAPNISPKKTWAGTIGGVFLGGLVVTPALVWSVAWLGVLLTGRGIVLSPWAFALLFVSSVAAVYGDLLESQVKRRANVKDAGGLLPGHGGVMERLDSICASFAAVWLVGAVFQMSGLMASPLQMM
jgi:phosphatidate cytidylyltransferase